jgi:hypothetical protein
VADGDSEPSARYPAHLGAFFRNVLVTRFDTRSGRLAVAGLAVLVAVVAVNAGVASAFAVGLVIALGLALAIVALERDRWAAQGVILAFRGQRQAEWLRDTGTKGTNGSRAEAEVWLGAHRPGTVPPRYRAIIAEQTGDPVVLAREVAALPDATALDRANRAQLLRSWEWSSGVTPDTTTFRAIIAELPDSVDRRMFETWLAQVDASERHRHGGRDWLGPLLAIRDVVPRAPLPLRWHLGVWLSRFAPVLGLVASSVVFSAIGLSLASAADAVPASYAETELSTRGDLPSFDDEGVWRTLPRLARALPSATPVGDTPLGAAAVEDLIADGLPTIIWTVDGIEVAGPTALRGGRIHEIEVLLSRTRLGDDLAIVTLRGPNGPSYLFRVDSTVVATLRAAAGIRTPAASG